MWALEVIVARNDAAKRKHDDAQAVIDRAKAIENCEYGCAGKLDNGTSTVCPGGLHT